VTPAARIAAAIEVLEAVQRSDDPPDRTLAAWGRAARFAGSKDRRAVADIVHDILRQRRSLAWRVGDDSARAAAIGWCIAQGADPAALFTGAGHAPAPLTEAERRALAAPHEAPPDPVRLDYPDWLDGRLRDSLGDAFEASMTALQRRAPVDMRANSLRCDVATARAALAEDGVATEPGPLSPLCLRAAPGAPVARTRAYAEGLIELQDAASQAVAAFAGARPGEAVLDYCAGGGGKTLALAADMAGRGRLVAHDVAPGRMRDLPARLARAGARAEIVGPDAISALRGRFDLVLADAPCSGSGSWRRDPAGKWRLTPARLASIAEAQRAVLRAATVFLRPGGRLVYATCSMLHEENAGRVSEASGLDCVDRMVLTPADGGDGFFAARCVIAPAA
jgi:16S rRNA (cytosine967-C5)-methyltransferase